MTEAAKAAWRDGFAPAWRGIRRVTAAALCLLTAAIGFLRPTLSAARVDPLVALRAE